MKTFGSDIDPKFLIAEAYRIEGINASECRSIFLDWALTLTDGMDARAALPLLLEAHGAPDHPMTEVLREGLASMSAPRRRGGWRSRPRE